MPRRLTPQTLLDLFARVPTGGPNISLLARDLLAASPESQAACRHLMPLFRGARAGRVALWDLYLAHYRHTGIERWGQIQGEGRPGHDSLPILLQEPADLRWGLVEGICVSSRYLAAADPAGSLDLATTARELAIQAPVEVAGKRARSELIALTWATAANAHRAADSIEEARQDMDQAQLHLERSHPPLLGLLPAILSFRVSLETWERRYRKALATADEALNLKPEKTLRARLLVKRANLLVTLCKPDLALESLAEATPGIDREEEPRFWYCAVEQQLLILTESGRFQEAEALLPEVRRLAIQDATPVDALRVRWVEARLASGQNDPKRAERLYHEIHDGFLRHYLAFSAAVVTLELCRLLLEQGRLEEVKTQAASTLAEFHRQRVEPEILSALALVEQAVLGQRLTLEVLAQARSLLERQGRQVQN